MLCLLALTLAFVSLTKADPPCGINLVYNQATTECDAVTCNPKTFTISLAYKSPPLIYLYSQDLYWASTNTVAAGLHVSAYIYPGPNHPNVEGFTVGTTDAAGVYSSRVTVSTLIRGSWTDYIGYYINIDYRNDMPYLCYSTLHVTIT